MGFQTQDEIPTLFRFQLIVAQISHEVQVSFTPQRLWQAQTLRRACSETPSLRAGHGSSEEAHLVSAVLFQLAEAGLDKAVDKQVCMAARA